MLDHLRFRLEHNGEPMPMLPFDDMDWVLDAQLPDGALRAFTPLTETSGPLTGAPSITRGLSLAADRSSSRVLRSVSGVDLLDGPAKDRATLLGHVPDVGGLVALAAEGNRREIGTIGLDQHPVDAESS